VPRTKFIREKKFANLKTLKIVSEAAKEKSRDFSISAFLSQNLASV